MQTKILMPLLLSTSVGTASNSSKQTAYIHIGPPKTATTSIQSVLEHSIDTLWQDGISVALPTHNRGGVNKRSHDFPFVGQLAFCLWSEAERSENRGHPCRDPQLLDNVWEYLNETMAAGHDIVISNEWLQRNSSAEGVDAFLGASWNVEIVLYYRRFHDFCRSWFHFHRKRIQTLRESFVNFMRRMIFTPMNATVMALIPEEGVLFPAPDDASYDNRLAASLVDSNLFHGYTWDALQRYAKVPRFANSINIKNFHVGDPVAEFVCHVLDAPQTCQEYNSHAEPIVNSHRGNISGVMYHLEDVAIEAYTRGYDEGIFADVPELKSAREKTVLDHLHKWSLVMTLRLIDNHKTVNDLPVHCLSDDEFKTLVAVSMVYEELIVPDYFAEQREALRADVLRSREDFCSVDAARVLDDDEWRFLYTDDDSVQ